MTPLERYEANILAGKINSDPAQHQVILDLDHLYHALLGRQKKIYQWQRKIGQILGVKIEPVKGLYLWGGVGRGKTFMMDLFFHALPFEQKKRYHFHHLMNFVHQMMKIHQGILDPLTTIAKEFAKKNLVLCIDELYVSEIADAMILAELFQHLIENGVTLVITSNIKPEDLYRNGLQREKFIPTIDLINTYTNVEHVAGHLDYRLHFLTQSEIYHYPHDESSNKNLTKFFNKIALDEGIAGVSLLINDRTIATKLCADSVVWFLFHELCQTHRATIDYIEIARTYHTVLVSEMPMLGPEREDAARRFISLVDEFYDRNVVLILSAEVPLHKLYQGVRYQREFERTLSRLTEMQSAEYLAKQHIG